LVREIVKSNLFGTSSLLGAYTVAVLVPMTLFNLITGGEMVSSSLVPVFSDYASKEKRPELWRVFSIVLSLATTVLTLVVILVIWLAPQIAWLAGARNFEDQTLVPITVTLMRDASCYISEHLQPDYRLAACLETVYFAGVHGCSI